MSQTFLATAHAAAEAAAAVHLAFSARRSSLAAQEKGRSDFVSEADLEAQRAALRVIRERHPDHQILAEEDDGPDGGVRSVRDADPTRPLWVVDPLDGTTNFLHGHPMHAASVAVVQQGRPLAGAVYSSATGERFWASRGGGAFLDGAPIRVSAWSDLRTCLVGTGFPFKALDRLSGYLEQLDRVLSNTAGVRRLGSAALDLCYLAAGRLDAFWELSLGPWDVAAGLVILEEAGGVVSDLDGGPVDLSRTEGYLAANSRRLHDGLAGLVGGPSL